MTQAPAKMPRSTKVTLSDHIRQVSLLLIQGVPYRDIKRYANEKWGASSRQTERYISIAAKDIAADMHGTVAEERDKALSQYQHIFARALAAGQLKNAVLARSRMDEIWGLTGRAAVNVAVFNGQQPPVLVSGAVDITELDLDTETEKLVLDALRRKQSSLPQHDKSIIDAETVPHG